VELQASLGRPSPIDYELERNQHDLFWRIFLSGKCLSVVEAESQLDVPHKHELQAIRDNIQKAISSCTPLLEKLNAVRPTAPGNDDIMRQFTERMQELSHSCRDNMVAFIRGVICASEQILGKPLCSYCAVGIGSIAQGYPSAYCKIKYLFIVEKAADKEYVQRLAKTIHWRILNLGETPLEDMNIRKPYFESKDERSGSGMVHTRGLRIKSYKLQRSLLPIGATDQSSLPYILTVQELLQAYAIDLFAMSRGRAPFTRENVAEALSSAVVLRANSENGRILFDKFITGRNKINRELETSIRSMTRQSNLKTLRSFHTNLKPYLEKLNGAELGLSPSIPELKPVFRYPRRVARTAGQLFLENQSDPWSDPWIIFQNLPGKSIFNRSLHSMAFFCNFPEESTMAGQFLLSVGFFFKTLASQPISHGAREQACHSKLLSLMTYHLTHLYTGVDG